MSKLQDIILVPFPLTNLASQKIRPALQLSAQMDSDVVLCAISTKKHSSYDLVIKPTQLNGLKKISYIRTNKIATIEKSLVLAKLGGLDSKTNNQVKKNLKKIFGL